MPGVRRTRAFLLNRSPLRRPRTEEKPGKPGCSHWEGKGKDWNHAAYTAGNGSATNDTKPEYF